MRRGFCRRPTPPRRQSFTGQEGEIGPARPVRRTVTVGLRNHLDVVISDLGGYLRVRDVVATALCDVEGTKTMRRFRNITLTPFWVGSEDSSRAYFSTAKAPKNGSVSICAQAGKLSGGILE